MLKRPMFFLALALSLGIFLQFTFPANLLQLSLIFSCLFVISVICQFSPRTPPRVFDIVLLLSGLLAGMLRLAVQDTPRKEEVNRFADADREVRLLCAVAEAPRLKREHWRCTVAALALSLTDSSWREVQGKVLISGKKLQSVALGEQIILRGRLFLPEEARNPGAFDYRLHLKAFDTHAQFWCTQDSLLWRSGKPSGYLMERALERARAWVAHKLGLFSQGQSLALLQGLLLGRREEINDEVITSFSQTGLIHVLSVSGLHVGFIALLLYVLADLLRVPRHAQAALVIVGLIFYAFLTELQSPVMRATIMAIAILLGNVGQRDSDIYNSLGLAALVILLWQPWQLFQLGFQLSFVAVWGIAYLYRPLLFGLARIIRSRRQPLRWALALLAVSFAAQFATLPFVVNAYGRLPLTAIWGNLVVIPASFLAVAAGVIACLLAPWSDFLLQVYGAVAEVTTTGMIRFTHWLARLPGAYIEGVSAPLLFFMVYLLMLAIFVEWRRPARRWLIIVALAFLNVSIWKEACHASPNLRITFFDVDQGDAILLEFPQDRRLLIDTGPWHEYTDAAERAILPYLAKQGIRRLQAVVITHPHADHLGGLPSLLTSWLQIDTVYFCGVEIDSWLEQRCEHLLDSLQVPYRAAQQAELLRQFEPAQVGVLAAGRENKGMVENVNNASVVLKILWGETALLFAGDAEWQSEWRMGRHAEILNSDLLKVGHHGSKTSSTRPFLKAVTPQWAVTSVGRRNKFRHPHAEVIARLDSLGVQNLRTDLNGAVVFESDGKALRRLR